MEQRSLRGSRHRARLGAGPARADCRIAVLADRHFCWRPHRGLGGYTSNPAQPESALAEAESSDRDAIARMLEAAKRGSERPLAAIRDGAQAAGSLVVPPGRLDDEGAASSGGEMVLVASPGHDGRPRARPRGPLGPWPRPVLRLT